jgi:hypothetical protein
MEDTGVDDGEDASSFVERAALETGGPAVTNGAIIKKIPKQAKSA